MPYDEGKDPVRSLPSNNSFGKSSRLVTKSDTIDLTTYAKSVILLTAGTVKILPLKNADSDTLTFESLPAGTILPYQVRRVFSTGTSATLATIDD